jgi:putative transcriptional regulator
MDKELFEQLHQSMKEAVAIAMGDMKPSRIFAVEAPDVKAVREKTGLS